MGKDKVSKKSAAAEVAKKVKKSKKSAVAEVPKSPPPVAKPAKASKSSSKKEKKAASPAKVEKKSSKKAKKVPTPPPPSSSSEESSDESSDEEEVKPKAVANGKAKPADSDDSSSEESSSEEEAKKPVAAAKKAPAAKAKAESSDDDSSDDSSSEEEEEAPKKKAVKAAPAAAPKKAAKKESSDDDSSSEEDSDDSSDEEEAAPAKKEPEKKGKAAVKAKDVAKKAAAASKASKAKAEAVVPKVSGKKKGAAAKQSSEESSSDSESEDESEDDSESKDESEDDSDSEDESDDDSESEKESKKKASKPAAKKAVVAKKAESSDEDSSDDDSDSEEEEEKPKAKAAAKEDSDDSSSEEDSDDDDEEEEEKPSKKRKAEDSEETDTKKAKGDENCKIYLKGLPWDTPDSDITDFFKACGKIESVDQPKNPDGRSSGTAYVVFDSAAAAAKAVEMDGQEIGGRWLKIMMSFEKPEHARNGEQKPKPEGCTTVFIGNLSWSIDEETVRATFGECGDIKSVRFAEDRETGEFRGFGHVEFYDGAHVDAAMALASTDVMGRPIRVDFAAPRPPRDDAFGGGGGGGRGGGGGGRGGGRGGGGGFGGGGGGGGGNFSGGRGNFGGGNFGARNFGGSGGGSGSFGGGGMANCKVFVSNLAYEVSWQDLKDHMRSAGNVIRADVIVGPDGRSKGLGTVEFSKPYEASNAISQLSETELMGRPILIREDRGDGGKHGRGVGGVAGARVFVGNLSWQVTWQALKDHMRSAGNVNFVDLFQEPGGRSKGCAIVEYETPDEAHAAIRDLHDSDLMGRMMFVREDREEGSAASKSMGPMGQRHPGAEGKQVYVGNLSWDTEWQALKDHFKPIGHVQFVEIPEDAQGRSKGHGTVRFANEQDATRAIAQLNNSELGGRPIFVREDQQA